MKPPFKITNTILNQISDISKIIGQLELQNERNLVLRKENRIKSIHSSLSIENNSLSLEQVTAIINNQRVLGDPKEIQEVKNTFAAYEKILTFNPYNYNDFLRAHLLITKSIVNEAGIYRTKDVGVYDSSGNIIHIGARPQFISSLINELFEWGYTDDTHDIIKSCVIHYEIDAIHPFEDGNGRIGRLWQSVILSKWHPIFEWIPIETIIHENQSAYYKCLAIADNENDSTVFIEFMLDIIIKTLISYKKVSSNIKHLNNPENEVYEIIKSYIKINSSITSKKASELTNKSIPTIRRYFNKFIELELIVAEGENKNKRYYLKDN